MAESRQSCNKLAVLLIAFAVVVGGFKLIEPSNGVALASAEIHDVAVAQDGALPETPTPVGMIIHIDPQTGAILEGPLPGSVPMQMSPDLMNALSTSHIGLLEVPSNVPGGGVIVDLQGRFQSPLIGTIDSSGKLRVQHLHRVPASTDKASGAGQEVSPESTDR